MRFTQNFTYLIFSPEHDYVTFGCLLSQVRLSSVVCNVRTAYSWGWNFRQYFFAVSYLNHPLNSVQKFTAIVPGQPLRRGFTYATFGYLCGSWASSCLIGNLSYVSSHNTTALLSISVDFVTLKHNLDDN